MKKQFPLMLCGLFLLAVFSSCLWRHHHSSVSISDSPDVYQIYASYDKSKTHKLQRLLDEDLRNDEDLSFRNAKVDAMITLEDRTTFYMQLFPGELKIKFDKTENSGEAYMKMKDICEDIKDLLSGN
jgi:hypothetical protein